MQFRIKTFRMKVVVAAARCRGSWMNVRKGRTAGYSAVGLIILE